MNEHKLRIGGVMRCCIETLDKHIATGPPEPQDGDLLPCLYCTSSLIYRAGAWEWNHE